MKFLLFLVLIINLSYSSEQVVFVLAKDFETSKAILQTYEKKGNTYSKVHEPISVNIGKKGLGWGLSEFDYEKPDFEPMKKEGDKKAPAGIFKLSKVYSYHNSINSTMPHIKSTSKHICVDDSSSKNYNKILETNNKKSYSSYENMLLKNSTYEYVIKVEHNSSQMKEKGSCIFLHVENPKKVQTSGCTSMKKKQIKKLISWLDIYKNPILIQIPYSSCAKMKQKYNFLECNLK